MKFTIIQSKSNISKKFSLDKDENLIKQDGGNLNTGNFVTADMNIEELAVFIKKCSHKQILVQGLTGHEKGLITTKSSLSKYENAEHATVSRSKDFFSYKDKTEGFLLIDYDPNEFHNNGESLSKESFLEKIYTAVPEIKTAPHIWKISSSSNIIQTASLDESNEKIFKHKSEIKGQHLIVHISDMGDINDFFDYLYKRLWILGEGYIFVDKVGRLHDRTIADKVVNSPEREIFLRACVDERYLKQDLLVEVLQKGEEGLNLRSILEKIDLDEINDQFEVLHKKELAKYTKESKKKLTNYVKKNSEKHSMSEESLRHSILERKLFSDFKIKLNDNTYVSVDNILEDPDTYSGKYCYEPFEPEYGGYCNTKAWIDAHNERIYSHAHGGIEYELVDFKKKSPDQLAHYLLGIDSEKKRYKEAVALTNKYKYELTEIDLLLNKISKSTGQKLKAIQDTYKKYSRRSGNIDSVESEVQLNFEACAQIGVTDYDYPLNAQFPHVDSRGRVSSTAANLKFMLEKYGIHYKYDPIVKVCDLDFPMDETERNNLTDEANYLNIQSMCVINGMTKDTATYLPSLMNGNIINPVYDWIKNEKWDGVDRIDEFIARINHDLHVIEDEEANRRFSKKYMDKMIRMWLVECIAALDGAENTPVKNAVPSYEYALVFVGNQGAGKTKFLSSLLPFHFRNYIVTGHELDTKNKDSIKKALSCWICELGELDSTFKKSEISSLKAFLSDETDIIRLPYGKTEMRMKRNTVFCGSVNGYDFLRDKTGNRRYLPVNVNGLVPLYEKFTYERDILIEEVNNKDNNEVVATEIVECDAMNVQQLWAQVLLMYLDGWKWWPDTELDKMLVRVTDGHSQTSFVNEGIEEFLNFDKNDKWRNKYNIVGDNKKYVDSCIEKVRDNVKKGEGHENGSIDPAGKSVTLFSGLNVKELFHIIGIDYNRQNMREFNEEMSRLGFIYSPKTVNGKTKKCYWVNMKSRNNVFKGEFKK